ncbi:TauD/TfdA family dioxygenase [Ilumatobacter sp.]|uniref:TauD/TfdA family dioxygenase n=1 Tax=Ilumatobacter sp. TaxID=1967498 RepID=UPI003C3E7963
MEAQAFRADRTLPVVASITDAAGTGADHAVGWSTMHREDIDAQLHRHGAVLISGFEITSAAEFRAVCAAIRPDLRNYAGGDSPRTGVADQVYTSTEYPADLEVLLHNELSYAGWSPDRLFFGCLNPADTGGETHLADGREISDSLDPAVRDRFERLGVTYLQHLWDADGDAGVGKSWQETFETHDRAAVETYLDDSRMQFEWTSLGLRTAATHPAILEHSVTGERCWHNQADQWHRAIPSVKVAFGGTDDARIDERTAGTETLGNHVTYGDGSEIDVADLMHVRDVSRACEVMFPWHAGDVLVIDNVLAMHGRKPFTGQRRVLAAMA